jgi:hypothetical protein
MAEEFDLDFRTRRVTTLDLEEVGIPARFWSPKLNPFALEPSPLEWWEDRASLSKGGAGFLVYDLAGETTGLAALCEILKRVVVSRDRPQLVGGKVTSCRYVRASDILRVSRSNSDWYDLVSVGFLLVAGVSESLGPLADKILPELFRARYEEGGVTFYHIVIDAEAHTDEEVQCRAAALSRHIPSGAYIS